MSCQNHLFCFNMIYIKLRNKYVLPFKEYFENLPNMICLLSYILMRRWYNKKKTEVKTPVFNLYYEITCETHVVRMRLNSYL